MKIEFCPKCGTKLEVKIENGEILAVCLKCGYLKKISPIETEEKYKPSEKVAVVEKEITPMPTTEIQCPRCGFNKAYTWTVQTRGADESETQFFRCKKCGYVWRLYG